MIAALVALSLAADVSAALPSPKPKDVACDVAAAYAQTVITEAKNRAVVFTVDDEAFTSPITGGGWWRMDGDRPKPATPPPAALIKRLEYQGSRNAVPRCPSVRKLLDHQHIGYGPEAIHAVTSENPSELFKARVHTISMPVVSADGKQAVLASSGVSGLLAGGGFLQLLERQPDGNWKVLPFRHFGCPDNRVPMLHLQMYELSLAVYESRP